MSMQLAAIWTRPFRAAQKTSRWHVFRSIAAQVASRFGVAPWASYLSRFAENGGFEPSMRAFDSIFATICGFFGPREGNRSIRLTISASRCSLEIREKCQLSLNPREFNLRVIVRIGVNPTTGSFAGIWRRPYQPEAPASKHIAAGSRGKFRATAVGRGTLIENLAFTVGRGLTILSAWS